MSIRLVTQRCDSARLVVNNVDKWVSVGHGLVVLVSFFKGATEEVLPKAVKAILNLPLLAGPKGRGASLAALAAGKFAGAEEEEVDPSKSRPSAGVQDILVVPQASLICKARGKSLQYHGQLSKSDGALLYEKFVTQLRAAAEALGPAPAITDSGTADASASGGAADGDADASGGAGGGAGAGAAGGGDSSTTAAAAAAAATTTARKFFVEVQAGTYGNRQGFELSTEGPMTHVLEF